MIRAKATQGSQELTSCTEVKEGPHSWNHRLKLSQDLCGSQKYMDTSDYCLVSYLSILFTISIQLSSPYFVYGCGLNRLNTAPRDEILHQPCKCKRYREPTSALWPTILLPCWNIPQIIPHALTHKVINRVRPEHNILLNKLDPDEIS